MTTRERWGCRLIALAEAFALAAAVLVVLKRCFGVAAVESWTPLAAALCTTCVLLASGLGYYRVLERGMQKDERV